MQNRKFVFTALFLFSFFMLLPHGLLAQSGQEEGKPSIAVWDFNLQGVSDNEGRAVTNRLRSELVRSRKFKVMTRDQIETLLGEQKLGQTLIDAKEAIRAGKLRGVKYVVTGSLISLRRAFQMTVEMIDGESAEIIRSITPRSYRGDFLDFLDEEVPNVAQRLTSLAAASTVVPERREPPRQQEQREEPPPEREQEREPARPLFRGDMPRQGLGAFVGFISYAGQVDDNSGYVYSYGSGGMALGVDFQLPLGPAMSLDLLYLLTIEGYAGDRVYTGDSGSMSHTMLGARVRFWLDQFFVAPQMGLITETAVSSLGPTATNTGEDTASGLAFGAVAGWEGAGGSYLILDYHGASMSNESNWGVYATGFGVYLGLRF